MRGNRRLRGIGLIAAAAMVWLSLVTFASAASAAPAAGPPYPSAVTGQRVYDYAGIFSPAAIVNAESVSAAIQKRTGAQVAIYTQVKPQSDTPAAANADAIALMNQWGVGRKGVDDGLAILFDMQGNLRHGQVSLYAGSGFLKRYMSNAARQAVYDGDMKPRLLAGDFDGALRAAMSAIDIATGGAGTGTGDIGGSRNGGGTTSPEPTLGGVPLTTVIVLMIGLAATVVLTGIALILSRPTRKDSTGGGGGPGKATLSKVSPAMATVMRRRGATGLTVTAGLLDLAANGLIAFVEAPGRRHRAGILLLEDDLEGNSDDHARVEARISHLFRPERGLYRAVRYEAKLDGGTIPPDRLAELGGAVYLFREELEATATSYGWLVKGTRSRTAWLSAATLELVGAAFVATLGLHESSTLVMVGGLGLAFAGVLSVVAAQVRPALPPLGADVRRRLQEQRQVLALQLRGARSVRAVAPQPESPWEQTAESVTAWAIALGLRRELQSALTRSLDRVDLTADPADIPRWWRPLSDSSGPDARTANPRRVAIAGLQSIAIAPAFGIGGMLSQISHLGSIHPTSPNPPSPSGGEGFGGGGGGFGGGVGGGGCGAGGGF